MEGSLFDYVGLVEALIVAVIPFIVGTIKYYLRDVPEVYGPVITAVLALALKFLDGITVENAVLAVLIAGVATILRQLMVKGWRLAVKGNREPWTPLKRGSSPAGLGTS